jgi:hypothetical protein
MKQLWWDYIVNNKKYWANGFTYPRLAKVKEHVFADKDIMWDLMVRHDGANLTPQQMQVSCKETFDHCVGNFFCNIANKMYELKIIKI